MFGLTYWGLTDPEVSLIYYIILFLFDGFVLFAYIHSIYIIIGTNILAKDIKEQCVDVIKAKPYKVKIIVNTIKTGHNVSKFSSGIKLYFNNNKKIVLIFAHYFDAPTKKQKENIIKEIMKKELELKYYHNSKIIVSGLDSYRKTIKNIIKE